MQKLRNDTTTNILKVRKFLKDYFTLNRAEYVGSSNVQLIRMTVKLHIHWTNNIAVHSADAPGKSVSFVQYIDTFLYVCVGVLYKMR